MEQDPFGNNPGTVRGLLAIVMTAGLVAMVLTDYYFQVRFGRPSIGVPDWYQDTTLFIIGLYFGFRAQAGSLTGLLKSPVSVVKDLLTADKQDKEPAVLPSGLLPEQAIPEPVPYKDPGEVLTPLPEHEEVLKAA